MNVTLWVLAGIVIGWTGFFIFRFNPKRGLIISMILAIAGALIGGFFLAPGLGVQVLSSGEFNPLLMFVASASALGSIILADML